MQDFICSKRIVDFKLFRIIIKFLVTLEGHVVAWWLRHYATNQQVAGSIPDSVIGIFQ